MSGFFNQVNYVSAIVPDFLYLCNDLQVRNLKKLKNLRITNIINCTTNIPNYYCNSFDYFNIKIEDSSSAILPISDLLTYFDTQCKCINRPVFIIHCNMGISRSTSIIAVILIHIELFKNVNECLNYIKKIRPCVRPNQNFINQIISFNKKVNG